MTYQAPKTLLTLTLAATLAAAAPAAQAAPKAIEEYKFETPSAGGEEGSGSSSGGSGTEGATGDSDAAVPILVGVLALTAAVGAGIAILRRQRT